MNLFKFFKNLSLRTRLFFIVGSMVALIAANGLIAYFGVQKVYLFSTPIAQKTYPTASAMVNALHSLEYSRALAIQYALENDVTKLSFLKRQFEAEFQRSERFIDDLGKIKSLPKEITLRWTEIKKSQSRFSDISQILMKAHEDQLKLSQTRFDQIVEANRILQKIIDNLNALSDTYKNNDDFQFWNIAAQVILLEQRYLYQPELSTPLSLSPESSKVEELKLLENKEKFRGYISQFNATHERFKKWIKPKQRAKWASLKKDYIGFIERVEGEEGVFLIGEDEIAKLGTVGFQLEQLETVYKKGAKASLEVQTLVTEQMKKASSTIYELKNIVFGQILIFTFIFACLGIALGMMIFNYVLRPLSEFSKATQKVSKGNLDTSIPISSSDEIGSLAKSFNEMIYNLNLSRKNEKDLHDSLEVKVSERTEALAKANIDLLKANEVKSEFLSNISHDLKTPLNCILGFTQMTLAEGKGKLTAVQKYNLSKVIKNGRELLNMINTVLDFTKAQAGKLQIVVESFSFEPLVDECLESMDVMLEGKDVKLVKVLETHLPVIESDRPKVKRVLLNLLSNAVKNTTKGKITISVNKLNGDLEVCVSDTGCGMSKTALLQIFEEEKVTQPNEHSSGLGLIITKQLITVLRGTIDVHSQMGTGTTFRVKIPVNLKSSLAKKEAA